MVKPLLDPALAQNSVNKQNLDEMKRKTEIEGKSLDNAQNKNKEKKLREACEGFESIFIQQMWQSMRASLPQDGLMHSREEKFWQGMYDQELSKSMASAGGIGLADMMMTQLSKNLKNASEVAAETTQSARTPLDIEPVPLIQKPQTHELTNHEPIPIQNKKSDPQQEHIPVENKQEPLPPNEPEASSPAEQALQEFLEQPNIPATTIIDKQADSEGEKEPSEDLPNLSTNQNKE